MGGKSRVASYVRVPTIDGECRIPLKHFKCIAFAAAHMLDNYSVKSGAATVEQNQFQRQRERCSVKNTDCKKKINKK